MSSWIGSISNEGHHHLAVGQRYSCIGPTSRRDRCWWWSCSSASRGGPCPSTTPKNSAPGRSGFQQNSNSVRNCSGFPLNLRSGLRLRSPTRPTRCWGSSRILLLTKCRPRPRIFLTLVTISVLEVRKKIWSEFCLSVNLVKKTMALNVCQILWHTKQQFGLILAAFEAKKQHFLWRLGF